MPLCKEYGADMLRMTVLTNCIVLFVVVLNEIMRVVLTYFTVWERHGSTSDLQGALVLKLFLSKFLNTSLMVMIINANFNAFNNPAVSDLTSSFGLANGMYMDLNEEWYKTVGAGITISTIALIFSSQLSPLGKWAMYHVSIWADRGGLPWCGGRDTSKSSVLTQHDLDMLHTGPEFEISVRYSDMLNIFFVAFTFSSAIPILVPCAAIYFALQYCIDKFCLLRLYRTPPMYNADLSARISAILPYGLIIHLAFAVWAYTYRPLIPQTEARVDVTDSGDHHERIYDTLECSADFGEDNCFFLRMNTHVFGVYAMLLLPLVALMVLKTFFADFLIMFVQQLKKMCCPKELDTSIVLPDYHCTLPTLRLKKILAELNNPTGALFEMDAPTLEGVSVVI
jgi:hypothetical protein